jgi:hypothetical protein
MVVPANQEALANYKKWQNVEKAQQSMGIDDYLPSSNLSPHKQKSASTKVKKTWDSKPNDGNGRVDDWLGSPPNKAKRSWKVKEIKSPEQMAREAAEDDDDDDDETAKPGGTVVVEAIPNLEESDSESEQQIEVESVSSSVAVSSVMVVPPSSDGATAAAPKSVVSVKSSGKSVRSTNTTKSVKSPKSSKSVLVQESAVAPKSVVSVKSVKNTETPKSSVVLAPTDNLVNQVVVVVDDDDDDDDDENENEDFEDDDNTEYHDHMKNKIGNFLDGNKYNSPGDASVMTEPSVQQRRRPADVPDTLADNCLDHVILACSNLKAGVEQFEQMTGLNKPSPMCTLRGVGTKSVRYHMGNRTFLEIMGPDDKQGSEPQSIGRGLLDIPNGTLVPYHYALRNKPDQIDIPESLGWERDNIIMVHAATEDFDDNGDIGKWDFVLLYGHGLGGVVPSFVNWRENKYHPTARLDLQQGAKIQSVQVQAPAGHYVHELMRPAQGITMSEGSTPTLSFSIATPKGEVVRFSTSNPEGIQMPGFGDDNHLLPYDSRSSSNY